MENRLIKVKIKNTYGLDRIYPLNFKESIYNLTGQKTLSEKQINAFKELGFTFKVDNNKEV